jgi:hypothetical protein
VTPHREPYQDVAEAREIHLVQEELEALLEMQTGARRRDGVRMAKHIRAPGAGSS